MWNSSFDNLVDASRKSSVYWMFYILFAKCLSVCKIEIVCTIKTTHLSKSAKILPLMKAHCQQQSHLKFRPRSEMQGASFFACEPLKNRACCTGRKFHVLGPACHDTWFSKCGRLFQVRLLQFSKWRQRATIARSESKNAFTRIR